MNNQARIEKIVTAIVKIFLNNDVFVFPPRRRRGGTVNNAAF
jgi:hypothetical protein